MRYTSLILILLFLSFLGSLDSVAQLGFSLNIDKPKDYEDRVLRAEKTDEKKFTIPRRFFQNTTTHYNYFFNANTKLNEVLAQAKAQHRDDYSKLISFYNYSLDATAANTIQLDSIILKSQSGIVLHDLRNDWIDNLYLLWGAAYYLRKDFDSANQLFQFINYAFAEKEKDGYYKFIGSNMDGNSATRISTKEDRNIKDKVFSQPPSRNDAFIWQIRTYIAKEDFTAASVLIEALKLDPAFPERLEKDLEEVQALWYYKQSMWDSAAVHLAKALDNAQNKQEQARWEFLLGQLHELTGNLTEASAYYQKAINHTTDPVMEIYARLNAIKTNRDSSASQIDENINELLKMARRDKYQDYRNIIYFMAAQMEMERKQPDAAFALLLKGAAYNLGDPTLQNKIFLQLAEMAFQKKAYRQAFNFYDSLRTNDPALKEMDKIQARKKLLGELAGHWEVMERQDSLQKIAGMPVEERDDYIKKLVRQMRRAQGLKDNADFNSGGTASINTGGDIFSQDEKGEWYFYNNTLRTRGAVEFKSRWGNRPNVDHWRRISAAGTATASFDPKTGTIVAGQDKAGNNLPEISYDALANNLPLSAEKMAVSNDSIQQALFALGNLYLNGLEDCASMSEVYSQLQQRFPAFGKMDQVLFNQYYCMQKNGNTVAAKNFKEQLASRFPGSKLTIIATTGTDPAQKVADPVATGVYEKIYDQFIEGNFTEAFARKQKADSLYGETYWTPQQLYIESVYYIQRRNDSIAIATLNKITSKFPNTPLAQKAITLIDVLKRRDQIEAELRNLQIERPAEDTFSVVEVFKVTRPQVQDSVVTKPVAINTDADKKIAKPVALDTVAAKPVIKATSGYSFNAQQPHMVMVVLHKVDPVFINEARTAMFRYNREKFYNQQLNTEIVPIDDENKLILIGPFTDAKAATDYVDRTKPVTSTQIMPWLKAEKYRYSIISNPNLEFLKTDLDINKYRQFLEQHLPGLF